MKILWVKSDFLHPTTRGGQIRTLELLRALHRRHKIYYIALDDAAAPEGPARSGEYSSWAEAIPHHAPSKQSPAFALQLAAGLFSPLPVAVARWRSEPMRKRIGELVAKERFDSVICDFLFPAPNIPDLSQAVLFQHNVESVIWERRAEHASDPFRRAYLNLQARRMSAFEGDACRRAGHVIAVSQADAVMMRQKFGAERVSQIPTGVDLDYFAPPPGAAKSVADLVFVGSLDWMPNVDGVEFFVRRALPLIHARFPDAKVALVGRMPPDSVRMWARQDPRILVTGTVPDVRPYLWGSRVSIVPLRIGGGTRLKIYEAIAAGLPVVSTTVGAEGLPLSSPEHISLADSGEEFAAACCALLENETARRRMAQSSLRFIADRFSWDAVARTFEDVLEGCSVRPRPAATR